MKKTNQVIASFLILLLLNSCGTIAEGLGGSKKKGSDEFLVEKKSPLVLPPSFGELPEPGKEPKESRISNKKDSSAIEDIINLFSKKVLIFREFRVLSKVIYIFLFIFI